MIKAGIIAGGAVTGAHVLKRLAESPADGFNPELIRRVESLKLDRMHTFSEAFESIEHNYVLISHYKVGDYEGPMIYSQDRAGQITNASRKAEEKHRSEQDIRSNAELLLLKVAFTKTDPELCDKLEARIQRNIKNQGPGVASIQNTLDQLGPEMKLADNQITLADCMGLMQILQTRKARDYLIDYIGNLVATSPEPISGLVPITAQEEAWRQDQPRLIYRDSLMWAKNMQPVAQLILESAPEIWFDGLPIEQQSHRVNHIREHGISNAGGIAMLISWETQNMTHVGDAPALSQVAATRFKNGREEFFYPHSDKELGSVLGYIEDSYGIPYSQQIANGQTVGSGLVGSLKRNFPSGGAVFGQFMPVNLRYFIEKYEASRTKVKDLHSIELPPLLPGSPAFIALLMFLYINGDWKSIDVKDVVTDSTYVITDRTKGGYVVGNSESQIKAWQSWNSHSTEVQQVHQASLSYYQDILAASN